MPASDTSSEPALAIREDARLCLLRHLSVPIWVFDVDRRRILWANTAGREFWNADTDDELLGRDLSNMSPQVARRLEQYRTDCAELGGSFREHWTVYPNDAPHTAEVVVAPFTLPDGRVALLLHVASNAVGLDDPAALHGVQALMHTSSMIELYDCHWRPQYLNPAARASRPVACSPFPDRLVDPGALAHIERALKTVGECEVELEVHTTGGLARHAMTVRRGRSPVTGDETRLVTAIDVTQRHAAELEVQRLAFSDSLTGLANRVQLTRDVVSRIAGGHASGSFAVLFLDLDRFKLVNDSLGHAIGDALLIQVAARLRRIAPPGATVARLGGDEFVVVGSADAGAATGLAGAILDAMEPAFELHGHRLRTRPSIGVCLYPEHGGDADQLMRHADIAMYAAKASQRGFVLFDGGMNDDARHRLAIENGLARALEHDDRLEIHYQPKVRCGSEEPTGFEALVRWRDPERGLVPPLEFIGIAEETGLIVKIGQRVMREAMHRARAWADEGYTLCMSINVSAKQFNAGDLMETVIACLEETGADPTSIELEITESVLLGDAELVADTLRRLSGLGVRIAIDDFGTGYSNLAYLKRYPLDCLKIDRAFVADPDQIELLELIIGIGATLGLLTVAEGVETAEQARWLTEHGCDELQGYRYGAPMPLEDASRWLQERCQGSLRRAA